LTIKLFMGIILKATGREEPMKNSIQSFIILLGIALFSACQLGGCGGGGGSDSSTGGGSSNNPEASEAIGLLDVTFGNTGKQTISFAPISDDRSYGVLYQPSDGKIIVLGQAQVTSQWTDDVVLVRYLSNGNLDNTFGTAGITVTAIGPGDDFAWGGNIDSNGRIVIVGSSRVVGTNYSAFICRYNTDGTLDNTFASDGKVLISAGNLWDVLTEVEFDSNGKIVAAGYYQDPADSVNETPSRNCLVVRYNENGTPDSSFSGDGMRLDNFYNNKSDRFYDIEIQSDDKIVCSGYLFNGNSAEMLVARYNIDGTFDTTFSSNGWHHISIPDTNELAYAMQIQPSDQKIVLAGYSATYNTATEEYDASECMVVRLNTDGSLDNSFSGDGISTFVTGEENYIYGCTLKSDGKILICGSINLDEPNEPDGEHEDFLVAQVNTDGSLDTSFNSTGFVTTGFGTRLDTTNCIVVQADGKILASGYADNGTDIDFALIRLTADGSLDSGFGEAGYHGISIGDGADQALAAANTADGSILLAGKSSVSSDYHLSLAKFTPDGLLDTDFGTQGTLTLNIETGTDTINAIGVQTDGNIIVCGTVHNGTDDDLVLVGLHPNGDLDNSFGGNNTGYYRLSTGSTERGWTMEILSDNRILVAGELGQDWLIARFLHDGTPDMTFTDGSTNGYVKIDFAGGNDVAYDLVVQPDAKIVVAGMRTSGANRDTAVVRLLPSGALDQSGFGTNGISVIPISATNHDLAHCVDLQANGQIVVGGTAMGTTYRDIFLARLDSSGTLDTAGFGAPNGYITTSWGTEHATLYDLAVHPNQKILVTGFGETSSSNEELYLARFLSDGTADFPFQGGTISYSTGFSNLRAQAMLPQSDGKIVLAGYGKVGTGSTKFVTIRFK
jgi:uncharacterized delta-60 repeat protein